MSKFYIPSSTSHSTTSAPAPPSYPSSSPSVANSTYDDDDDDEDTLPYPTPLPRSDFLSPTFRAETYLSSLHNRHQTLEDLRSDLRQRSQLLNKELLDLVNGNYEEFLSLGGNLRGGEERVEGVRVGVLGFGREIEGILKAVRERELEAGKLLRELREVGGDVAVGRGLVEVGERIEEMEVGLGITEVEDLEDEVEDEIEEDDGDGVDRSSAQVRRLRRYTQQYVLLMRLVERIGSSHPFLQAQRSRLDGLRKTLLLDLAAALRQAKNEKRSDDVLEVVKMYAELGAERDGVRSLKGA